MRGVDSRGGGYPGESGNPPAGGRGRGMVLPAWMTSQPPPQAGGLVSLRLLPTTVTNQMKRVLRFASAS